jgi:7-cyano-7-deazaguanine tRNA-ribosyltransferase
MEIVAGLSLKNLKPRVWDPASPYYLSELQAVMVSYADFDRMPVRRLKAMEAGLHSYLGVAAEVTIYLDNGAFYFIGKGGEVPRQEYAELVQAARPDWYAIPQDYIPIPRMSDAEQLDCLRRTMEVNRTFQDDGYVPVVHISRHMDEYLHQFLADEQLCAKPNVALGGIVPNLLRAPKAMPYGDVLDHVRDTRARLAGKQLHVFGIGGTATLHLAALLDVNSVDSSGWRNRAARGIVQLPGRGDRVVANLGSWRGREPDEEEWNVLAACRCPACQRFGVEGLKASRLQGFCNRATHNLWTLLDEARQIEEHLADGTYETWYEEHVDNSIYRPLIDYVLRQRSDPRHKDGGSAPGRVAPE